MLLALQSCKIQWVVGGPLQERVERVQDSLALLLAVRLEEGLRQELCGDFIFGGLGEQLRSQLLYFEILFGLI